MLGLLAASWAVGSWADGRRDAGALGDGRRAAAGVLGAAGGGRAGGLGQRRAGRRARAAAGGPGREGSGGRGRGVGGLGARGRAGAAWTEPTTHHRPPPHGGVGLRALYNYTSSTDCLSWARARTKIPEKNCQKLYYMRVCRDGDKTIMTREQLRVAVGQRGRCTETTSKGRRCRLSRHPYAKSFGRPDFCSWHAKAEEKVDRLMKKLGVD